MKTVLVYDTKYGNTKYLAERMHSNLKSQYIDCRLMPVHEADFEEIQKSNVLIVASPTHYWNPSTCIIRFLEELGRQRIREKMGFMLSTRYDSQLFGSASKRIFTSLKILHFMVYPWQDFYVKDIEGPLAENQVERCDKFSEQIVDAIARQAKEMMHANQ
ncbi:MAG: flavodoxin domain-containing protein [Candidatus Woesearchaeota archaeon]